MQSHWGKQLTIRVVDAGYLLAGMEPERKWQFAPPLVANFFNLIRDKTGAVKLATMPGERMEITQAEFQALKTEYGMTPATEPQATTPSPAPVVQTKAKRRTWMDVSSPHIVEVMQAGQYATAKELFRALEAKAGPNSPFDKGTGDNRGSLFVREIAQSLNLKTVQNEWQTLRKLAQK